MNISLRYGTIFFTLHKFARAYLSKFASEIMWFLNPTWVKTREFFFSANKRKGFFVGHFAPSFIMIMPRVAIHLTLTKVCFVFKKKILYHCLKLVWTWSTLLSSAKKKPKLMVYWRGLTHHSLYWDAPSLACSKNIPIRGHHPQERRIKREEWWEIHNHRISLYSLRWFLPQRRNQTNSTKQKSDYHLDQVIVSCNH